MRKVSILYLTYQSFRVLWLIWVVSFCGGVLLGFSFVFGRWHLRCLVSVLNQYLWYCLFINNIYLLPSKKKIPCFCIHFFNIYLTHLSHTFLDFCNMGTLFLVHSLLSSMPQQKFLVPRISHQTCPLFLNRDPAGWTNCLEPRIEMMKKRKDFID